MSLYSIASRVSSLEYSVDELGSKADSITGVDVVDVAGLQNAFDLKAPKEPDFHWNCIGYI